jgi:two-component system chemotaxis response regulator CheB
MPKRDIFVIGASAGGVDALQQFASQLPRGFPGAVFIVLHISPRTKSLLPELLSRTGCLPAVHPEDGERIDHRRIYVAPPDRHLVIQREHVHLSAGPREQHHRPCINVLFRSAALAYGERVVGTVLTGELDDGTAGLWEVKRRGGIAVVQNSERAAFPSMALSALREIEADYVAELGEIGALFLRLAAGRRNENVPRLRVWRWSRR